MAFLYFLLAGSSWARQEGFSQYEKNSSFTFGQEILSHEDELLSLGDETPSEKEQSLPPERKIPSGGEGESFTRGQKTLLLNGGAMLGISIYGLTKWEYGDSNFHVERENWFQQTTKDGGADKFGHFWIFYTVSHLYSYEYRNWGYTDKEANLYGSLSSFGSSVFMELLDGFSPSQGFSYEDMIMNIAGCGVAYVWGQSPRLASKIDFRAEYTPQFNSKDSGGFNNYDRQKFIIALKADGFDSIKNPYLRYLELQTGYYARGYEDYDKGGPDSRRRNIFIGLGLNASKLVQKFVDTRVFDYIQIPCTSVNKGFKLD